MKISAFHALRLVVLALAAFALPALGAAADDTFFHGKWKITEAQEAPWVVAGETADPTESEGLVGKTIVLSAKGITGPGGFPCGNPKYEVIAGGADILFQGAFGEMHAQDPKVDPQKLAEQIGFSGKAFRTVVTGCAYEVDFSFGADPNTAKFGLNDYVYTLRRQ